MADHHTQNSIEEQMSSDEEASTFLEPSKAVILIIALIIAGSYHLLEIILEFNNPEIESVFLAVTIAVIAFKVLTIITLYRKTKIGWILVIFTSIIAISKTFQDDIITVYWLNEDLLNSQSLTDHLIDYFTELVIPLAVILYLNKMELLQYFTIGKKAQIITISVSVLIGIAAFFNQIFLYDVLLQY